MPEGFDLLVVAGAGEALAAALSELAPERIVLLTLPTPPAVAEHVIREALAAAQAFAQARVADQLVEIGRALNAQHDPARLLELILEHARQITHADAGSIYLVEDEGKTLHFRLAHNDSVDADFSEFTMPVTESSIVGACVRAAKTIRIDDLYVEGGPMALGRRFHHDRSFDERFGYQTRSMITTPMITPDGEVLAVIQLINAKDHDEQVRPFTKQDERLCKALASQAAVALENARLVRDIQALFEGFVRASVHAIEQRDPTTSGHSQRVADLTVELAKAADRATGRASAPSRSIGEDLREIEYAGLLHDFGKVGVREEVLVKAKKLYDHELSIVLARFDHMRTALQLELLREQLAWARAGKPDDEAVLRRYAERARRLQEMLEVVRSTNEPTVLPEDAPARIQELAGLTFCDADGERVRVVNDDALGALMIRRGSLTETERLEIQSHVTHTYNFLVRIPWGQSLARVPEIAGKHHEYLDGSGYPSRLDDVEIPLQTRMMTVSDIYDALTAADRPYKKAVPTPKALDILHDEAGRGRIDADVLELFIGAGVYKPGARP